MVCDSGQSCDSYSCSLSKLYEYDLNIFGFIHKMYFLWKSLFKFLLFHRYTCAHARTEHALKLVTRKSVNVFVVPIKMIKLTQAAGTFFSAIFSVPWWLSSQPCHGSYCLTILGVETDHWDLEALYQHLLRFLTNMHYVDEYTIYSWIMNMQSVHEYAIYSGICNLFMNS